MSTRGVATNNVIAGAFVLAAIALAIAFSVILSGAQDRLIAKTEYSVRFSLEEGAAGLKPGSVVNVGGQPVGRVTSIDIASKDGRPDGVLVLISVREDLPLFSSAWAYLQAPLIGGLASINLPNVGYGDRIPPGGEIPGRVAPPSALAQAGYGPDQVSQVQEMIRQASQIMERVDRMTARIEEEIEPGLADVRAAIEDFRAVGADLRARTPEWSERVDSVLAQADSAATNLNRVIEDARAGVGETREAISAARDLLDRNAEPIDRIIADTQAITSRVNEESVGLLNDALAKGADGAERFSGFAARAEAFFAEEGPQLRRILANFRLASDQIKLAAVEIRTKPWLLLYTPKTKELESELLYQTARTYAEAVSDLRAASEALEAATASGSPLAVDRESIQGLQRRITDAFATYKQAEQSLLDLMIRKRTGP